MLTTQYNSNNGKVAQFKKSAFSQPFVEGHRVVPIWPVSLECYPVAKPSTLLSELCSFPCFQGWKDLFSPYTL